MERIDLGDKDCAFVIEEIDGKMKTRLCIPNFNDDDAVPDYVTYLLAVMIRMDNKEFFDEQIKWAVDQTELLGIRPKESDEKEP